jgi:hypothetical protein
VVLRQREVLVARRDDDAYVEFVTVAGRGLLRTLSGTMGACL